MMVCISVEGVSMDSHQATDMTFHWQRGGIELDIWVGRCRICAVLVRGYSSCRDFATTL